jgi:hypothetical protein
MLEGGETWVGGWLAGGWHALDPQDWNPIEGVPESLVRRSHTFR